MDKEDNAAVDNEEASQYALAVGLEDDMMEDDEEEDEEDNEDDEQDGEVEEDEDEEESALTFNDGVNPMDLMEDGAFTDQLYRKFVGMDYEALAEKKRKALGDNGPGGSVKKARQDDLSGATMEEIMEAMNYGMQRRSRKRKNVFVAVWRECV